MAASGLKLIVLAADAAIRAHLDKLRQPRDQVMLFDSASAAIRAVELDSCKAYNIDAIVVAERLAEDLGELFDYAPHAARILLTETDSTSTHPSFGASVPASSLRQSQSLAWLRAGLEASKASRAPSAKLFVHLPSRSVLSANPASLRLIRNPDFGGGQLAAILDLPGDAFDEESWRGTVEAQDDVILGVTSRRISRAWLFIALSDITDVVVDRANDRHEGNLMLLGRAAAVLAHEIGNPLAAIKTNLQLVAGDYDRLEHDAIQQYLGRSLTEVSRLSGIVSNYLSFVRKPETEVTPLADLVESAIDQVGDMFRSVKIRCEVSEIPAGIEVEFGTSHFHQIAWNVAKNAVDSMLRAKVQDPKLRVHVRSTKRGVVQLCFDDNGGGLPQGQEERLFDAFVTTKGSGTGLGLMVCRLLARQSGGDIRMVRLEQGARALLTMRIARPLRGTAECQTLEH